MGKGMNKKILLGSIIAVVILILVSFTGVVGYQTTKSSTIAKASPLFSIRTSRAIDEESKDIACDYVGKGEESILSIPKRDGRTALVQKFIDRVSKMDDETFNRFIGLVIKNLNQMDDFQEYNIEEIIQSLNQFRNNPKKIKQYITEEETILPTVECTIGMGCPWTALFCISIIIMILIFLPFLLVYFIPELFTLGYTNCS